MRLILPWPPTVNTYWRRHGHTIHLSNAGRQYRTDVQAAVLSQHGLLTPLAARVRVSIVAHAPDQRNRDLDNLLKGVLDSLVYARVLADDGLIDCLRIERAASDPERPRVEVEVVAA